MQRARDLSSLALAVALCVAGVGAADRVEAQAAAAGQFAETAATAASADDTVWQLQAGTTLNYGNARSFQLATGSHFLVLRDMHQFTFDLSFNFGVAQTRSAEGEFSEAWDTNSQNLQGKLRYDFFVDPDDGLFAVVLGRNDPFAGLDFRFQGQLGYLRNFVREGEGNAHRVWGEIGLDVTYDDRFPNPLCPPGSTFDADMETCLDMSLRPIAALSNDETQLSGRLYLGYDNHLNANWSLLAGVELLYDFIALAERDGTNVRLTVPVELRLMIETNLQASLRFQLLYDGEPVPGRDPVDTSTVLTVVYTLL